jgi:hypothetical protein
VTSKPFTDNPEKQVVRAQWDTPVLRYLNVQFGTRYRYMGLPGVDLLDIRLWRSMIDEVVAFEPPDDSADRRQSIVKLRRNLQMLNIQGVAYYGSLEEVVLRRRDFDGQAYAQNRVITLYNFDFCDEIGSSIETSEKNKKVLRFEAIRQVLRDQVECYRRGGPNYFVFMLTVRNQIDASKINRFLRKPLLAHAKEFRDKCQQESRLPERGPLIGTYPWALKTFLFDLLCQNFANPNLSAICLPFVLYQGTQVKSSEGRITSPMMHWVLVCKFDPPESQGPEVFPISFLPVSSVAVSNNALIWKPQTGEVKTRSGRPDSEEWLSDYGTEFLKGLSNT